MRKILCLLILVCVAGAVHAKDSEAQARTKLQGYVKSMKELEAQARGIQPMNIPLAGRTRAQDKEMMRRIEFVDNLLHKNVKPLALEVNRYEAPARWASVKDAANKLHDWFGTKVQLQNAGVNNPGLEYLKKSEPIKLREFQEALKKAEADLRT